MFPCTPGSLLLLSLSTLSVVPEEQHTLLCQRLEFGPDYYYLFLRYFSKQACGELAVAGMMLPQSLSKMCCGKKAQTLFNLVS